jgi:hypothetical protein
MATHHPVISIDRSPLEDVERAERLTPREKCKLEETIDYYAESKWPMYAERVLGVGAFIAGCQFDSVYGGIAGLALVIDAQVRLNGRITHALARGVFDYQAGKVEELKDHHNYNS